MFILRVALHQLSMSKEAMDIEMIDAVDVDIFQEKDKKSLIETLCLRLVRRDAVAHFHDSFAATFARWSAIMVETSPPHDVSCTDRSFITAFQALDRIFNNGDEMDMRLGYVQLIRLFKLLTERVAVDRQKGCLHRKNGYRNVSIAFDIYMDAYDQASCPPRRALIERKRIAQRWSELAGPWPMFLLIYSENAEQIVSVIWFLHFKTPLTTNLSQCPAKADMQMLRLVAARIFRESPSHLLAMSELASGVVQKAAQGRESIWAQTVQNMLDKVGTLQQYQI
jgi:hypothetical protein